MNLRSVSTGNLPSNSGVWMSDSIDISVAPLVVLMTLVIVV